MTSYHLMPAVEGVPYWTNNGAGMLWCASCGRTYDCIATSKDFTDSLSELVGVDRAGGVYGWLGRHDCRGRK